jgi:hypothetical protein
MHPNLVDLPVEDMAIPSGASLVVQHIRREALGLGAGPGAQPSQSQRADLVCVTQRPARARSFLCACGHVRWVTG